MNYQNKTVGANSLSLVRDSLNVFKTSFFVFIAAAFLMSGFFAPQIAFAATATPASEGTNISLDTSSAVIGGGSFTSLEGPAITETVAGDISAGTHTISLPSGWEFDTISNITISKFGNIVLSSTSVTPGSTSFSFVVSSQSTSASVLGFSGLKVKPTGTTPSTGNMTHSGAGIVGVVNGSTNFGTLTTITGTVTKLAFTTQPGGAVYGSLLSPQPVVKTQDQFGNNSINGLAANLDVTLTKTTGTGTLQGTVFLDIGTGAATPGTATFTDLKVGGVGAVGTKQLTAAATGPTSAVSGNFEITPKTLTASVTVNNKLYDGNNSAVITGVTLNGVETGDDVTVSNSGIATFASLNANTGIVITSNGVTITGIHAGNYSFGGTATGSANITPLEITITPTAGQTKVYGQLNPVFAYTFSPALISPDVFTGALSRVSGEDVNTYAYTLGTLSAGPNYSLTLGAGTFEITKRTLAVSATGINKVYDANTTATVTLGDDRVGGDELTLGYTATFTDSKNVGDGKLVSVTDISITGGADAGNYILGNTTAATTANITAKPLTISFTTDANKTYNGSATATITGRTLDGVISPEVVGVTGGSATFADTHIGLAKTATATGFALTGVDSGNYSIGTINTTTGNVNPRPITITAVTDSRIYNGAENAAGMPIVTSTFSPAVALVDTANFTQTYNNKNVGTGKTLTPSGAVIDGNNGANYTITPASVSTGAITKKSINVTAQPDTKTYDGTTSSDDAPVVDALETGDTVGTAPTQAYQTKDFGAGKTLIPSGLVINDGNNGLNYSIVNVNNTAGVINAKGLTVTGATTNSKTYDGGVNATVNFASAALNGVITGEESLVSLDSTGGSATFNNKNVGTGKTVTVSGLALAGTGAGNYSLTQPVLNNGVIEKRPITVTSVTNIKLYDGLTTAAATPTIIAGTLASGDTGTFTETYDNANVGTTHVLTPAGTIADADSTNMTENYDITFTTIATGIIDKASLTITADDKSKTYGTVNPTLTASYSGFVNGETSAVLDTPVSLSTTAVDASPVGAYPITASGATDANYDISHFPGTLTVTPAPLTVTADAKSKTYGDADPTLTYTHSALAAGDTDSVFSGALSRVAGKNAGTYSINQGNLLAGNNYAIAFVSANLTINKKPITVTAVTNTKTYDGNANAVGTPTFPDGSLVGTDAANFTETYDTKDVGTGKTLMPTGIVNDGNSGNNYIYTFETNTAGVITAKPITVTPNSGQTKIFGEVDPIFTYTSDLLISPDTFTGALGRATGENVGTYAYTLGTLSAGGNYTLTLVPGTFAITKATPVITWTNPADIVYGTALSGTQLNATADVGGVFVYAPASGTALNAGVGQTLSATFTPTDTANYNNAGKTALITVTMRPLTVAADNKTKERGTPDPALTSQITTGSLVGTDSFTGALGRDAGEATGTYSIKQGTLSAGSNYNITYVAGTLTITDTIAPTVVSHTPSFNALNISPTTAIVVTFSEPVDVEEEGVSFDPEISDGFTISNPGTNVVTITPNDPLEDNTTYTITLAGVADINGNPLPTYGNIKFTTATNYSINLNANASGWNLISLPVVPSNTAIATVLGSAADNIDAVWTYDPTNPNAVNGWLVFVPGSPEGTNNLTLMTTGFGYWVSVTDNANLSGAGTLLIAGPTPPPSRSLQTGWNLIGYYQLPSEGESTPMSAFASIGAPGVGYNGLWGFDNTTGFFTSVETINPGDAFWISLPSAKIYTPSNIEEES